jgi:acetolactate synthase-1/2/3 large subunit
VVFGVPGGPISPVHDALLDRPAIRVVTTRHESGALFAAAGYAQATGKIGVALVTSGPGVLNALTGLGSAWCDGLPVLLLVGEVAHRNMGKGALQDGSSHHLNIVAMASHVTKMAVEVRQASQVAPLVQRAIATALSGRQGPVVLTLPMDATLDRASPPEIGLQAGTSYGIPRNLVSEVLRVMGETRRGLIFAGSGTRRGTAPDLLRQFAERCQWPVVTTLKGKGVFPEDHPLALGCFGMAAHPSAVDYLRNGVDTVLAIGTSLGEVATDGFSPLLEAKRHFIHVDIEAAHIGRAYQTSLGLIAPADQFLRRLLERLPAAPLRKRFGVRTHSDAQFTTLGSEGLLAPQRALWEIQQTLRPDTLFTCDMGEHTMFASHYLRIQRPDQFIVMTGLGSMGSAIGAAIGAQIAHPDRPVAAIIGDGCLAMYAGELATLSAERLPVRVFVMNDERLGMVEIGHAAVYNRSVHYPTTPLDVARLAESLGVRSLVVTRPDQILNARELIEHPGPIVIDVRIDRTVRMPRKDRLVAATPSQPQPLKLVN